jgi:hypothetical protein
MMLLWNGRIGPTRKDLLRFQIHPLQKITQGLRRSCWYPLAGVLPAG